MDLRSYIIEAHKARIDLFKWKLILTAGLGAAALGILGTQNVTRAGYLLALIPLVCLYVDLLCVDQTLRVVVIARYLHLVAAEKRKEDNAEYESFVSQATAMEKVSVREIIAGIITEWPLISAYGFFASAQYLSTFSFAIGVLLVGSYAETDLSGNNFGLALFVLQLNRPRLHLLCLQKSFPCYSEADGPRVY